VLGLTEIVDNGTRLEQLKELLRILADEIDERPGARDLAQLSRQYRETLKEIEEIEGAQQNDDDISEILSERAAAGKSGAVR
jgi:predicted HAD superfamily Cof-like phosphohydrolase